MINHIILPRGEVCTHKTILTPPLLIVSKVYFCVFRISILPLSMIFLLDVGTVVVNKWSDKNPVTM